MKKEKKKKKKKASGPDSLLLLSSAGPSENRGPLFSHMLEGNKCDNVFLKIEIEFKTVISLRSMSGKKQSLELNFTAAQT